MNEDLEKFTLVALKKERGWAMRITHTHRGRASLQQQANELDGLSTTHTRSLSAHTSQSGVGRADFAGESSHAQAAVAVGPVRMKPAPLTFPATSMLPEDELSLCASAS